MNDIAMISIDNTNDNDENENADYITNDIQF